MDELTSERREALAAEVAVAWYVGCGWDADEVELDDGTLTPGRAVVDALFAESTTVTEARA